jgi:hypothetical protein
MKGEDSLRPHDKVDERKKKGHSSSSRAAPEFPARALGAETAHGPGSGIGRVEKETRIAETQRVGLDPVNGTVRAEVLDESDREVMLFREGAGGTDLTGYRGDVSWRRIDQSDAHKPVDVVLDDRR